MTNPKLKINGREVRYIPTNANNSLKLKDLKAKYEKSKLVSCLYDELPPLGTEEDYMKGVSNDFDNLKDGEEFPVALTYIVQTVEYQVPRGIWKKYIILTLVTFHAFSVAVCAEEIQEYYNEEDIDFKSLEVSDTISLITICQKNKNSFLPKRLGIE